MEKTIFALLFLIVALSCSKDDDNTTTGGITNPACMTKLPTDTTDIAGLITDYGDPSSSEVWLYENGGPVGELGSCNLVRDFPDSDNKYLIQVHQALTYNNKLYDCDLSDEQLSAESDINVEILDRVIRHFKAQGKRVLVFGHSYGSLTLNRYLWKKGPNAADKYILMGGRIDVPEAMWQGLSRGEYWYYPDPYNTPVKHPDEQPGLLPGTSKRRQGLEMRLAGNIGKERYSNLLATTDLSKVIYAVGEEDDAVGILSSAEQTFLEGRGAIVIRIPSGDHDSMLFPANAVTICQEFALDPSSDCPTPPARSVCDEE